METNKVAPQEIEAFEEHRKQVPGSDVLYKVNETPPWYECMLLGFQHYLAMFVATLAIPNVLSPGLCLGEDNVGKAEITGTLFFVSGFVTVFQALFGIRLPIVQGGTYALMAPTLSYLNLPQLKCPTIINDPTMNVTLNETFVYLGSPEHKAVWQSRLRTIQGSMMVACLLEILLGLTGLIGFLLRYIGPLSICPTISLLGLSLASNAASLASHQWWICISTVVLMVIFSQYLGRFNVPCFFYSPAQRGCTSRGYPIFKMFPILLSMAIMWLVCYILTLTNVLPNTPSGWGYGARTDIREDALTKSPWVRMPYPGQWGSPTIDVALIIGLFAGFLSSIVESVGDYYACARLSDAPSPPIHAINRGITIEGFGCFLAGLFGTGNGTSSSSVNVGVIGLTKVGSRRVVLYTSVFMIILAIFNKFGALFVSVPDPIIGGTFFLFFAMIVAVGISNLQFVDMNSSRNLFVFGFSFFVGVTIPQWLKDNPGSIHTGVQVLDNVFTVLLTTNNFVGGVIAFFLDNTIPGTREERGIAADKDHQLVTDEVDAETTDAIYQLPFCAARQRALRWTRFLPICPGYGERSKSVPGDDTSTENRTTNVMRFNEIDSGIVSDNQTVYTIDT